MPSARGRPSCAFRNSSEPTCLRASLGEGKRASCRQARPNPGAVAGSSAAGPPDPAWKSRWFLASAAAPGPPRPDCFVLVGRAARPSRVRVALANGPRCCWADEPTSQAWTRSRPVTWNRHDQARQRRALARTVVWRSPTIRWARLRSAYDHIRDGRRGPRSLPRGAGKYNGGRQGRHGLTLPARDLLDCFPRPGLHSPTAKPAPEGRRACCAV